MTFPNHSIVLHKTDASAIGIVIGDEVEWWSLNNDRRTVSGGWYIRHYHEYLKSWVYSSRLRPNFTARLLQLGVMPHSIYKTTDSPLVQKIKELDYKWELKMKEKGNFFLTSRALNVDQETTSQSTQMDTATVSGAAFISQRRNTVPYFRFPGDEIPF